jgi:hypothetical protein
MNSDLGLPPARASRKRKTTTYADDDDASYECRTPAKKTKKSKSAGKAVEVVDLTADSPPPKKALARKRDSDAPTEEKRARLFRKQAPQSYMAVKERALTQRLTVLSRERCGSDDAPEEKVVVAGSTGNVYTVSIGPVPSCDCPHAKKGNQCKHIVYVMLRVLKAKEEVAYQLALVSSELREVIKNAPPIPGVETDGKDGTETIDGNRKPIEGECPICYDDLDDKETIVYCKASCGNNVHKTCMQNWMAASRGKATCPYCRAKWEEDTGFEGKLSEVDIQGLQKNESGYVNVGNQLGLNSQRDMSTYHPFWVRQQMGSEYKGYGRRGYYEDDY